MKKLKNKLLYWLLGRDRYLLRRYKQLLKYWVSPKRDKDNVYYLCKYIRWDLKDDILLDDIKQQFLDIPNYPALMKQTLHRTKGELEKAVNEYMVVWHSSSTYARIDFLKHVINKLESK